MYRNIDISFWTDPKVDDDFTPEDKYFYLYLLTNPHTHLSGCYEISLKQMERETGYNQDTVFRLLKRMENQHRVIRFSETNKEVLLLNWYKYNWTKSQKLLSAIHSNLKSIKTNTFRDYISEKLENLGYGMDRVSIPHPTVTVSVSDTGTDAETENSSIMARSCETTSEPEEPAVYEFPCIKGETYAVTQSQIDSWMEDYPNVDVHQALRNMRAWLRSNPSKRKTAKGCTRFINRWLSSDQDSGKNPRKENQNGGLTDGTISSAWDAGTV